MTNTTTTPKTTYTIGVYVALVRPSATRCTAVRTFEVVEDATILGGCRAIDIAVAMCHGHELCDIASPTITPNPAELGWPVGA